MIFSRISADALKPHEFWCACCDYYIVKSDDESTGHFYNVFGAEWGPMVSHDPKDRKVGEEYKQVIFALCPECESKFKQCGCCSGE